MNLILGSLLLAIAVLTGALPASAGENVPYFVSLKGEEVFMREGPSEKNRIKWVYHRKGMPIEVIATFDVWRRVRDVDGEIGWMHVAVLSRDRTALVKAGDLVEVRARESAESTVVAQANEGAIGRLLRCGALACELRFEKTSGWIDRARLWGVRDGREY